MLFIFCIFLILVLFRVGIVIRSFVLRRKNIPAELFAEGLKDEKNGYFSEAIIIYESALYEINKSKYSAYGLKNKIIKKLKILYAGLYY